MNVRQPKPQAEERKQKQAMEQVPKQKLQIVWTLDGVTAESLLTYQNKPAKPHFGKTRFVPSQNAEAGRDAGQRHEARVNRTLAENRPYRAQLQEVARQQYEQSRIAERDRETPQKEQNTYERR